jgi:hypothetical protein
LAAWLILLAIRSGYCWVTSGTPALGDARLFAGDRLQSSAEESLVIEPELGDPADCRRGDNVGCVEAAAETDLDDAGIGGLARKSEDGGRGGDFEEAGADVVRDVQRLRKQRGERLVPRSKNRQAGCAR